MLTCTCNSRASKYIKQKLIELQGELIETTIIVGGLNTLLKIDKKQKIAKDIVQLNSISYQLTKIDMSATSGNKTTVYTLLKLI